MAELDRPPSSEPDAAVWQTMIRTISEIYPGGVLRLGPLGPLVEELDRLATEASELIDAQVRFGNKISGTVESGMLATSVANDPRLHAELARHAGVALSPPASVSYFHYHQPGDYLLPHADPIVSSGVLCLTNLDYTPRTGGQPPSALVADGAARGLADGHGRLRPRRSARRRRPARPRRAALGRRSAGRAGRAVRLSVLLRLRTTRRRAAHAATRVRDAPGHPRFGAGHRRVRAARTHPSDDSGRLYRIDRDFCTEYLDDVPGDCTMYRATGTVHGRARLSGEALAVNLLLRFVPASCG